MSDTIPSPDQVGVLPYTALPDRAYRGRWLVRAALWLTLVMPLCFVFIPFVLLAAVQIFGFWGPDPPWVDGLLDALVAALYAGPIASVLAALMGAALTRRSRPAIVTALVLGLLELGVVVWSRWQ